MSTLTGRLLASAAEARAFPVSYGMAQAAAIISLAMTQTIVTLGEQFPSNVYPWMELAERTRAQFVTVLRPGDDDWTPALLASIDRSTGVVAVPHYNPSRRSGLGGAFIPPADAAARLDHEFRGPDLGWK